MLIEFDPEKNERNTRESGLSFEQVADFDFETAIFDIDDRHEYGEVRRTAYGYLDGRLHFLCFVTIPGGIRVISFRKANPREVKRHARTITPDR